MDRARFKHHFTGPLCSINTPFREDGAIDYDGLRRFVDAAIAGGARTILFTPGDSLYAVLSEQEIADLTRATREHVGSRAMFLAAAGPWWRDQAVAFARYAAEIGADGVLASPPYRGVTVRDSVDYFLAVSRELPTVILSATLAPLALGGALEAVRLLLAEGDRIVGFKEDYGPEFARPACLLSQGTWSNFAGGQKQTTWTCSRTDATATSRCWWSSSRRSPAPTGTPSSAATSRRPQGSSATTTCRCSICSVLPRRPASTPPSTR